MIIRYDEQGKIHQIFSEPPDEADRDRVLAEPGTLLIPVVPHEPTIAKNMHGKTLFDEAGEPIFEVQGWNEPDVTFERHMVVNGEVVDRPGVAADDEVVIGPDEMGIFSANIKADGKDYVRFQNLLDPATVIVDGEPYVVTGGKLDFTTKEPGMYQVKFDFPHQEIKVEITAK